MPKLPVISGKNMVEFLLKAGYEIDHQTGSHVILRHREKPHRRATIPNHKEIAKGTLLAILRQVGLSREEFFRICSD